LNRTQRNQQPAGLVPRFADPVARWLLVIRAAGEGVTHMGFAYYVVNLTVSGVGAFVRDDNRHCRSKSALLLAGFPVQHELIQVDYAHDHEHDQKVELHKAGKKEGEREDQAKDKEQEEAD